jgi:ubiquitin-activating enzyme E1
MSAYQEAHEGALPDPTKPKEAQDLVALAEVEAKKAGVELDTALMARMARCCSAELNPMAALAGGVVGQEVLKACTGKFMPISQFFYWDASAVLPEEDLDPQQYAPLPGEEGARYTHQVAVLGRKLHSRLVQGRYFLVGAGAIGCEMLKNWALMGVASDRSRGMVEVTDMDTIEKSNLSRQFLFRTSDIGQLKSECAAKAVRAMNPAIQVHASTVRVGPATEDTYDEKFWVGLDGVITALDNVAARLYVDSRCVYFRKPLIDSGTLGTKGNTQVVVPYKSESYGSTQDPPEESIPLCTLKHFPNKIEHTIQWARDAFEGWFKQGAEEVNNYLSNPSYLSELEQQANTQLTSLETVRDFLLKEKPILFTDCIKYARLQFEREFNHAIKQLLLTFPKDSKDSSGNPFWSGLKRAPTPLVFDAQDPVHMAFIVSAAHLRAFNFGLKSPSSPDLDEFRKVVAAVEVPGFKPKAGVRIAKDDAEAKKMQEEEEQSAGSSEEHEAKVKQVISELPKPSSLAGYRLNAVEFEKDDDTNHHMEFITACSNLRARCYEIKEASMHQTKFIAGKIIPAIATTTAMVTGMVCLELYKLLQLPEGKPLEAFQSCFANLAVPIFQASEPLAPAFTKTPMKKKEGGVWEWSLWDRIDIDLGDCTLQALLDHFLEEFGMEVNMLSYGSSMLYYNFGGVVKKKVKDRLGRPLSKVIQKVAKVSLSDKDKYIVLEACVNDPETMDDLDIPYIRVKLHD